MTCTEKFGYGIAANYDSVIKLFKFVIFQGYSREKYNLGCYYYDKGFTNEGYKLFREASKSVGFWGQKAQRISHLIDLFEKKF